MWGHFFDEVPDLTFKNKETYLYSSKETRQKGHYWGHDFHGFAPKVPARKVGDYLRLIFHQAAIDCTCHAILKRILAIQKISIG